ncbi:MAG: hypothetical protein ABSF26_07800 [Thermoguttaceae bacterium]|jgi:hypothetical protein
MRRLYHEAGRIAVWVVLILAGIVTPGCDRPPPLDPDVPTDKRILMLVDDVDDFSQSKDELGRIRQLFVPESQPSRETLLRYVPYRYEGKPPVRSGDSATVTVMVKDAKTGNPVGEVQWSITKVDGVWRIKDAPLPDAGK